MTYNISDYSDIVRHAHENAYYCRVEAYLRKTLNQNHSLILGGNGGATINRLKYTGTSDYTDRFHHAHASGRVGYNFHTNKISLYPTVGMAWEENDINGKKYHDVYPFIHINLQYTFSEKHVASVYSRYATNSSLIVHKTSNVLQDNEFLYITGNPYLKNSRHIVFNFNYTWLPSNGFSMSAYSQYFGTYNKLMTIYTPYDDGKAILRSYTNDGDYNHNKIGVVANIKLFDSNLQLYVNPQQAFYRSTGIYTKSYNPFTITTQAVFYLSSCYFQAYYASPVKDMLDRAPMLTGTRNYHSFAVGWSNNHWNIRLTAYNFFNKGWRSSTIITESKYYSQNWYSYSTTYHPRINLSCTYTFNYGKKVQHNNEIGQQGGASSAILK